MIALIITGAVLLLIAVIMSLPLVFIIDYQKEAEIKIRLLFFDLFTDKEKKKKKLKKIKKRAVKAVKSKKTQPAQTAAQPQKPLQNTVKTEAAQKSKKGIRKNIPEIDIKLIRMMFDSLSHPFKRLIKKVKITELRIDSIVGGSDAAMAAINFGLQNTAIYGTIAWLKAVSSLKVEHINIQPDFLREESELKLHCKVKTKIGTVAVCGLIFLMKIIRHKAAETAKPPERPHSTGKANLSKRIHIVLD